MKKVNIENPSDWKGNRTLGKLPKPFRWTIHNLVAHPLSEVLYQIAYLMKFLFGKGPIGKRVYDLHLRLHDGTVPYHKTGTGRG